MSWSVRIALGLAACVVGAPAALAQKPQAEKKAQVELRWVESKSIEGLTEETGYQTSCDPHSIMYPHKKPALVLTSAEVSQVRITDHHIAGRYHYLVKFELTKDARDKLAATCKGKEMHLLTVVVDGKCWGLHRYESDENTPFVPAQARAKTFEPDVGFFSSRAEAERVANAVK